MDEIRDKLKLRRLTDGFERTPLIEFNGRLASVSTKNIESFGKTRVIVVLEYDELEVIDSREPWPFPVCSLEIGHSDRKKSAWGTFEQSLLKFIGPEDEINDVVGKRLHMKYTGGHLVWDMNEKKEMPREHWEVMGIEGGAGNGAGSQVSKEQLILQLLEGKTKQEFTSAALRNQVIKGDGNLVSAIVGGTLISSMEAQGLVHKDGDGKYQLGGE